MFQEFLRGYIYR